MNPRHIETINQRLILEVGYASDMGAAGLTAAIREALEKGGVLREAAVVYIRAEAPEERYVHISVWSEEPEVEEEQTVDPDAALEALQEAIGLDGVQGEEGIGRSSWETTLIPVNEENWEEEDVDSIPNL